ncbi:Uma2 family endonuclease [Paludisphaera sp.]|uniref:Uma2 family endonuclease n=1 Tax=Paludisphaera sp. TaxID=2017432 RepID=UPI00301DC56F
MSTASRPRLMTAEEFMNADLGEGRFELVRGEVVRLSPPFYPHAAACANITLLLGNYGQRTGHGRAAGEGAVRTRRGPDTLRGPDVQYFSYARWPREARRSSPGAPVKLPPVAPDVVVEVVSPNDRRAEVQEKVEEYLAAGALAVWVVRPDDRTVAIHRDGADPTTLAEGDAIDDQPELPGFRCMAAEIFED